MDFLPLFGELVLRSSLVLGAALGLVACMRRASAAARHLVLVFALILAAVLPVGLILAPRMIVPLPAAEKVFRVSSDVSPETIAPNPPPPASGKSVSPADRAWFTADDFACALAVLLAAGSFVQIAALASAAYGWRSLRGEAKPFVLPESVARGVEQFCAGRCVPPILASRPIAVPVLLGWVRTVVLIPETMLAGEEKELAMAICHELAHERRGDARLTPLLAWLRVIYWWHPLVWLAMARLRRERESACDDLVLEHRFRASDYAELIMEAARRVGSVPRGALAMASTSCVEGRIRDILDPARNRRPVSREMRIAGVLAALVFGTPLASLHIEAAAPVAQAGREKAKTTEPQIELEFKLIGIPEPTYQRDRARIDDAVVNNDVVYLIRIADADSISTPSVSTVAGLRANIDILRDFPYATEFNKNADGKIVESGFKNREVGITIQATPKLSPDGKAADVSFYARLVSFTGWNDAAVPGARVPRFSEQSLRTQRLMKLPGDATMWLGNDAQDTSPVTQSGPVRLERVVLVISTKKIEPVTDGDALSPQPDNVMVRLALRFFQIDEDTYAQHPREMDTALANGDITYFSAFSDFDLLTEPTALVKPGEQVVMEAMNPTNYPVVYMRQVDGRLTPSAVTAPHRCGVRVELQSKLTKDAIDLRFTDEISGFVGLVRDSSGVERPAFNTTRHATELQLVPDHPCGLWTAKHVPDVNAATHLALLPVNSPMVRVGLIVTADIYTRDGARVSHW